MTLRPLEDQYEPSTAKRIRELIELSETLRRKMPKGAVRYYFLELGNALAAGTLLAALHLSATTVELFVRAMIIDDDGQASQGKIKSMESFTYQERLEEDKSLTFKKMLDHLVLLDRFKKSDVAQAIQFYQEVRTPLCHGLLERFANGRPDKSPNFMRLLGTDHFTSMQFFEAVIEDSALDHIDTALAIIGRNV